MLPDLRPPVFQLILHGRPKDGPLKDASLELRSALVLLAIEDRAGPWLDNIAKVAGLHSPGLIESIAWFFFPKNIIPMTKPSALLQEIFWAIDQQVRGGPQQIAHVGLELVQKCRRLAASN